MGVVSSTIPAALLLTSFFLLITRLPRCSPLSFSYNFSDSATYDRADIAVEGDATLPHQGDRPIDLTQNPDRLEDKFHSWGRASYSKPVPLWDNATGEVTSFTTCFSFVIKASGDNKTSADGIAFFLSPHPSKMPPQSGGGYLGLFNQSTPATRTPAVVAVEFNTFSNEWDPCINHIGIDVNSINFTAVLELPYEDELASSKEPITAWVSYNGSTKLLAVTLQLESGSDGGMSSYELNSTVDLKSLLPPEVAIGFSAASGWSVDLHRVLSWSFNSTLAATKLVETQEARGKNVTEEKAPDISVRQFPSKSMVRPLAGAAVGAVLISVAVLGLLIWFIMVRRRRRSEEKEQEMVSDSDRCSMDEEFENGTGPRRFRYAELAAATNNFSEDGKLGEGGFGEVYKGTLSDLGLDVAVKRISKSSKQGRKEYVAEVTIISRLRHRNLVELVGWCHRGCEFLLVYELVPNGSLDARLHGTGRALTWPRRHEIALGLGSALLYLHAGCDKCVVHRDVKPSNIMLDASLGAKLGDFGLAKLLDHGNSLQTAVVAGTLGYMDPEYAASGRASTASDVYSFGIVLLEICCGRGPVLRLPRREDQDANDNNEYSSLLEWVWGLYGRGAVLGAADHRLNSVEFDKTQMECVLVVGLWCAHPDRAVRPSIKQALGVLQFEAPLPALPPKMPVPTYSPAVAAGYGGKVRNPAAAGSPAHGDSSSAGASSSFTGGTRSTTTSSSTTVGPSSCCPESSVVSMQQTAGM